jgi:hypothetical protein
VKLGVKLPKKTANQSLYNDVLIDFANKMNIPAERPPFSKDIKADQPPEQIRKVYIDYITDLNKKLEKKKINDERIKTLETATTTLSFSAIVLPIIMTAITAGVLVFVTQNWLTALVNLVTAVPPFFANLYKTKTENWYKGSAYKFSLKMLEAYINRIEKFTDDILRNLDGKIQDLADKIISLGSA